MKLGVGGGGAVMGMYRVLERGFGSSVIGLRKDYWG